MLYPPAVIAKQLLDLDTISNGRVCLGVGVGGEHPEEFLAVGMPIGTRGPRTDEAIDLLRRFWTSDEISFTGRFYDVERVRLGAERWPADRNFGVGLAIWGVTLCRG